MKFTEKKAQELIESHGLAAGTFATWKKRESIPDKYEAGIEKKVETEAELQQTANLITALKTEKFNIASLCRLAEISGISDVLRGKATMSKSDLVALKKAINTIRIEVRKVLDILERRGPLPEISIKAINSLLKRKELSWYVVYDRDDTVRAKIDGWLTGRRTSFPDEVRDKLKAALLIFYTETAI